MENKPLLDHPDPDLRGRNSLVLRPPCVEPTYTEFFEEPGSGLLVEYWGILWRRKGTLAVSAFLGLLAAVLFTLPETPVYRARASVEIQNLNENFLNMREVNLTTEGGSSPAESDLQTQVKILQSESVLERVIVKLNLAERLAAEQDHSRLAAWRKALGVEGPQSALTVQQALGLVAKRLTVRPVAGTRLVEVLYESTDPHLAADFANTLTVEFAQQNLEARWKTTQQTSEWLTRQMDDVRIKLERSEDELQSYASATGLLFTSEKDNVAEDKLRQLQEELSKAQAERANWQSKYELASTAPPESLPEVLDDKTLEDYQVKLTDLRRQLAELSTSLTPAHPAVEKVQAQVTTLEAALEKERANVIQRIQDEFQSAQRRENLIARTYASQARLISEEAAKVAHYNILKREVDTNRQLYDSLLRNVQEAGVNSALRSSNVRLVDTAQPPTHPYKPNLLLNAALGLLAGAFFGVGFVVMRARTDQSIQAPGESTLYLEVPELGVIPSADAVGSREFAYYHDLGNGKLAAISHRRSITSILDRRERKRPRRGVVQGLGLGAPSPEPSASSAGPPIELVTSEPLPSVLADSFRAAFASILYSGENGDRPRAIVVTSASPREGKTTVATNLALAAAEIGQSVLLIDGDLRKGRLHEIFRVSNAWGLSDLLAGTKPPEGRESMVVATGCGYLYLLPAGSPTPNISGLLYSPHAPEFMARMRQEFHTVIIDTPPMLNMPDARVLGRMADGVVLVVRAAQATKETVAAATQRLREDGTRVLGTILNEWDPRETPHSGYAYGYRYYHHDAPGS